MVAKYEDDITKVRVKKGQILTVECLVDGRSETGFFLIKDEARGLVYRADKLIGLGAHVEFDSDQNKLEQDGLEFQMYLTIKEYLKGIRSGMERGPLSDFGEVNYVLTKNLAAYINDELGERKYGGFTPNTVGKICRSIGFRCVRTAAGYAVVLEEQDLRAVEKRFEVSPQAE